MLLKQPFKNVIPKTALPNFLHFSRLDSVNLHKDHSSHFFRLYNYNKRLRKYVSFRGTDSNLNHIQNSKSFCLHLARKCMPNKF